MYFTAWVRIVGFFFTCLLFLFSCVRWLDAQRRMWWWHCMTRRMTLTGLWWFCLRVDRWGSCSSCIDSRGGWLLDHTADASIADAEFSHHSQVAALAEMWKSKGTMSWYPKQCACASNHTIFAALAVMWKTRKLFWWPNGVHALQTTLYSNFQKRHLLSFQLC